MRRFELHRDEDESGISGTGVVAEGVVFRTGWVAMAWLTKFKSAVIYPDMATLESVHGHGGKTRVVWHDPGVDEDLKTIWSLVDGAPEAVEALKRIELSLGTRELAPEKAPEVPRKLLVECGNCGDHRYGGRT